MDGPSDSINLLTQLGVHKSEIRVTLLKNWSAQLNCELDGLEVHGNFSDLLEFVDRGASNFLTNMSLAVSLFLHNFNDESEEIMVMSGEMIGRFEEIVNRRFQVSYFKWNNSLKV